MKKLMLAMCVLSVLLAACAASKNQGAAASKQDFGGVTGKSWKLASVQSASGGKIFDGGKYTGPAAVYTIQFDNGRATGKAAPNRYNAPYTLKAGNAIAFGPAAATLMMGINIPQCLSEHEFFKLLEGAYSWELGGKQLKIYTSEAARGKLTMVFEQSAQ